MAIRFYKKDMIKFEDYYPVESCGDMERFRCKCGHLEQRIELVMYNQGWLYDNWKIKCERCGTIQECSG